MAQKDNGWDKVKQLENESQVIEMWLFTHKAEVDQKRLETYELLRRIQSLKEEVKIEPRPSKKEQSDDRRLQLNSTGGKLRRNSAQDGY